MPTLYSVTENIMHVHKPKPVNSFREFLSEIGVIVVGIVIAEYASRGQAEEVIRKLPPEMRGVVAQGLVKHPLHDWV